MQLCQTRLLAAATIKQNRICRPLQMRRQCPLTPMYSIRQPRLETIPALAMRSMGWVEVLNPVLVATMRRARIGPFVRRLPIRKTETGCARMLWRRWNGKLGVPTCLRANSSGASSKSVTPYLVAGKKVSMWLPSSWPCRYCSQVRPHWFHRVFFTARCPRSWCVPQG